MSMPMVFIVWLAATTTTPTDAALMGTDTVPSAAQVANASVSALLAVVVDGDRALPERARAVRLLGSVEGTGDAGAIDAAAIDAAAIDSTLAQLRRQARGELQVQVVLAQADRARRRSLAEARQVALTAIADTTWPGIVVAGVVILWQLGGPDSEVRLRSLAVNHADASVRGACRGRLAQWPRSGGWRRASPAVLDPPHGGPSPAPRR